MQRAQLSSRNSSVSVHSWKPHDSRPENELRRTLTGRIQSSETRANSRSTGALDTENSAAVPRYGVQEDQENSVSNAMKGDEMGEKTQDKPENVLISKRIISMLFGLSIILENKGSVARDHVSI